LDAGRVVGPNRIQNGIATTAWESRSAVDAGDIKSIRIGTGGLPLGSAFTVNTTIAGAQTRPVTASASLGHALVSWTSPLDANSHQRENAMLRVRTTLAPRHRR
jgi:hypothetical protein